MRVVLKTKIKGNHKKIIKAFDRELFLALAPAFPPIELKQFTGSETGDKVHIHFKKPINSDWLSDIIDHGYEENRSYFVDKGVQLPFPLKFWEHHHIVEQIDKDFVYIIDDMRFKGPNIFITFLLYPFIYLGFLPRKRIYKKYFEK